MGFVEGIFCEIRHIVKYLICHIFGYTVIYTAGHLKLLISVYKILTFLGHYISFLLRHSSSHQIASSKGISCQLHDYLHNLFLIYNTTVGRLKYILKKRCVVSYGLRVLLSVYIIRYKIHRSGTIQGYSRNNILKIPWLKLLHEALHTGTFKLEHSLCVT